MGRGARQLPREHRRFGITVIILEGWVLATWFGCMPHPHDDKGSMPARSFKLAIWVLLFAVAVGPGAATGSAVAHDLTHAGHHSADMHSTGICAWMCAAGAAIDTTPLPGVHHVPCHRSTGPLSSPAPRESEAFNSLHSRAPPAPLS